MNKEIEKKKKNKIAKKFFGGYKQKYNAYIRQKETLLKDFLIRKVEDHIDKIIDTLYEYVSEGKSFDAANIAVERYCNTLITEKLEG